MFLYLDHLVGLARHLAGVARHLAGVAPYPLVFLRDTGVMNLFTITANRLIVYNGACYLI